MGLGQAWRTLQTGRGNPSPYTPVSTGSASWIRQCAPQLAEPFRGTSAAEESSVAALLARTAVQAAVSVHGLGRTASTATSDATPRALLDCLTAYDQYLQAPLRRTCTMLVCRSHSAETDRQQVKDLDHCRAQMVGAAWLRDLQFHTWTEPVEPLPLELAQVIAASVTRHVLTGGEGDPVFDAVSAKLANDPFPRGWSVKPGRSAVRKRG
jgi:hypothetical protein